MSLVPQTPSLSTVPPIPCKSGVTLPVRLGGAVAQTDGLPDSGSLHWLGSGKPFLPGPFCIFITTRNLAFFICQVVLKLSATDGQVPRGLLTEELV